MLLMKPKIFSISIDSSFLNIPLQVLPQLPQLIEITNVL